MPRRQSSARATEEPNQAIACVDSSGTGAWMARATAPVELTCGNTGDADFRPLCAPDRTVAVPDSNRGATERLATRYNGRGDFGLRDAPQRGKRLWRHKCRQHQYECNRLPVAGARLSKVIETASPRRIQCVLKALIERIELSGTWIKVIVRLPEVPRLLSWDGVGLFRGDTDAWTRPHATEVLDVPANAVSMKRELTLLLKRTRADPANKPNRRLVGLLQKARAAQQVLDDRSIWHVNEMAAKIGCHPKRFTRLVRLNYLAPDIIASIRDGTQPPDLDCRRLMASDLPMDWSLQRRLLGFPDQPDFLRAAPGW